MFIKYNFEDISFSPWIKLNLSIWGKLIDTFPLKTYKSNSILFQENENLSFVYIVKTGRIRLTISNYDGDEKHLMIAEKGCIIGENSCLLNAPSVVAATSIVETAVYQIPKNEFLNCIYQNPSINKTIIDIISIKNAIFTQQILELSFSNSKEKVAKTLYDLVNLYGIKYNDKYRIDLKFTHQDVAHLINTSRVTVSKNFSCLLKEKIIEREDGYIVISNLEKLKSLSNI